MMEKLFMSNVNLKEAEMLLYSKRLRFELCEKIGI